MRREIIQTLDGSTSIHLPDWKESYHSKHGAIQEAYHVFIKNGLDLFGGKALSILEIGFGTGLNAFITFLEAKKQKKVISYCGIEAYPISLIEINAMNFVTRLEAQNHKDIFEKLHFSDWEIENKISDDFSLTKRKQFFQDIDDVEQFELIYFDAFGYNVQPELWSTSIFDRMYKALKPNGILVTYAARSVIKRSMIEVGFTVEKLPGAPGKREMFRARKQ